MKQTNNINQNVLFYSDNITIMINYYYDKLVATQYIFV